MVSDGGAYGLSTEGVMRKAAILSCGPYSIANVKIDTFGVYTNNTPSGAFRTFGAMQAQFATESMLDLAADQVRREIAATCQMLSISPSKYFLQKLSEKIFFLVERNLLFSEALLLWY